MNQGPFSCHTPSLLSTCCENDPAVFKHWLALAWLRRQVGAERSREAFQFRGPTLSSVIKLFSSWTPRNPPIDPFCIHIPTPYTTVPTEWTQHSISSNRKRFWIRVFQVESSLWADASNIFGVVEGASVVMKHTILFCYVLLVFLRYYFISYYWWPANLFSLHWAGTRLGCLFYLTFVMSFTYLITA